MHSPQSDEGFRCWLAEAHMPIRVSIKRTHGRSYLTAVDFNIVGVGRTHGEAQKDLSLLLRAYLYHFYSEGRPFSEAIRRAPQRTRWWIKIGTLLWKPFRRMPHEVPDYQNNLERLVFGQPF